MDENITKQPENLLFPELFPLAPIEGKQVEVSFTAPDLSSEGGLLLLCEFERCTGFIAHLSNCIHDDRSAHLVHHSYNEMLVQCIFQIACGYVDADDCDLFRDDSLLKLCVGKSPDSSSAATLIFAAKNSWIGQPGRIMWNLHSD